VNRLIRIAKNKRLNAMVRTQVHHQLNTILKTMKSSKSSGASTDAHREYLVYLLEKHFDK